jgi:cell division protease FtsH
VRDLVAAGSARAEAILGRRRADLDTGAALLLQRETLSAEEFAPLRPVPAAGSPASPAPATGSDAPHPVETAA